MVNLIYIALGGAIGAVLRYGVAGVAQNWFSSVFPWGTLSVNLIGSFLIGILFELSGELTFSSEWRSLMLIGLLGSFTTFSTFTLETMNLIRDQEYWPATLNVAVSCVAGLALVMVGVFCARSLLQFFR